MKLADLDQYTDPKKLRRVLAHDVNFIETQAEVLAGMIIALRRLEKSVVGRLSNEETEYFRALHERLLEQDGL